MARQRSTVPPYQRHSSGRARIRTYDANGNRIEIILPGEFGCEESKAEYARILARLAAGNGALPALKATTDCTIAELVLKFLEFASIYYVGPVTKETTNEVVACRAALRPLCRLYGKTPRRNSAPWLCSPFEPP